MSKSPILEKFVSLLPYFLLALAIIAAYRITGELGFFVDFIRQAWDVVSPFFYGFLLAYIINIPCASIQKMLSKSRIIFIRKRKKLLSFLIVFSILVVIIILILNLVIPAIVDSISFFVENIPVYWASVVLFIDYFNELEFFGMHISAEGIFTQLGNLFGEFSIDNILQPLNALMGVGAAVFSSLIAFISSIYIFVEKDRFKALISRLLKVFASRMVYVATIEIFSRLNKYFRQYIRTQTIDGIILGTMATLLLFAIGSPYALVLGIMLGVVNYIPYFGSIFGTIVAVVVVTFTQGLTMGAISAVSLLFIQQVDANIVQPRLMSDSFALSPLLVIISITIGGAIAGILGMLVAIPIIAVLKDIFDSIVNYYENKKFGKMIDGE
ncbi:MAG: AI-2E family transporter [Defluviitaleaceae bacterium]|nr:AI-2E family transporter [Defluviitaleaceae bacterium]